MKQLSLLDDRNVDEVDCSNGSCLSCKGDLAFLRRRKRPAAAETAPVVRVVDLFAGCGGMSVGFDEAARRAGYRLRVTLALDSDKAVLQLYQRNIPAAKIRVGDVASVFDGDLRAEHTLCESEVRRDAGVVDVLLAGPPCQGHSDLNNHTRRRDPKNALYVRTARAAEVLAPKVVVIENVTPVQRDRSKVVETTCAALRDTGYVVHGRVLDLRRVGVPQRRQRYVLLASKIDGFDPQAELETLANPLPHHPDRTVGWAISDLLASREDTTFDTSSNTTTENARRIDYLFKNHCYDLPNAQRPECHQHGNHSYVSMYGRLRWDKPAQTITTGFGSMGQGRYVHPKQRRTITPHEAARLQTFPDWFDFLHDTRRGVLAKVIGNAVPPLLMVKLGRRIMAALGPARVEGARRRA